MRTAKISEDASTAWLVSAGPCAEYSERERRLFAKGILIPPRDPGNLAGFRPVPAGDHPISREVMDQIWEEERKEWC